MSTILTLPDMRMIQGVAFDQVYRFLSAYPSDRSPVDLTDWTLTLAIAEGADIAPIFSATLTAADTGEIGISLSAVETDALFAAIKSERKHAIFQITLRAPDPAFDQVWQGGVSVAARIA